MKGLIAWVLSFYPAAERTIKDRKINDSTVNIEEFDSKYISQV
jgi:hypothetical protein